MKRTADCALCVSSRKIPHSSSVAVREIMDVQPRAGWWRNERQASRRK
jgi:hypothetical protein